MLVGMDLSITLYDLQGLVRAPDVAAGCESTYPVRKGDYEHVGVNVTGVIIPVYLYLLMVLSTLVFRLWCCKSIAKQLTARSGPVVVSVGPAAAPTYPKGIRASYIKPVQAGSPSDASFMSRHTNSAGSKVDSGNADDASSLCRISTLFHYNDPVSPHLAAERDGGCVASDTDIVEATIKEIKAMILSGCSTTVTTTVATKPPLGNLVLVEAAGGVLSPAPSGSLQADAFRPMRLPVLLVGDGKLGGIGTTLSALESLRTRGYSVLGIALLAQGSPALICLTAGRGGGAWVIRSCLYLNQCLVRDLQQVYVAQGWRCGSSVYNVDIESGALSGLFWVR